MKSKKISRVGELNHHEKELYEAILSLKTIEEVQMFFRDLSTPAELLAMIDRWRVVRPILEGTAYRTIHDQTGVSVTTIGRVARELMYGAGGYKLIYDRLKEESGTKAKKK